MIIIKNSKELAKLVNKHKDLIFPDEDVRIEFEPKKYKIRNVECRNLYLENDEEKFDFNGGDFKGWDFKGGDFNGGDFNGWNFNGKKISYYAFFICYNSCTYTEVEARRENALPIQCLDGECKQINTNKL